MNNDADHQIDLRQMANELPAGFEGLLDASLTEGVRNLARLGEDWRSGLERFDRNGSALFAAFQGELLIGIAGTSREQNYSSPAMRMRRLFVRPDWRRKGVARLLAQRCMSRGLAFANTLTCNARASPAAGPFWESMGFRPVDFRDVTHVYDRV